MREMRTAAVTWCVSAFVLLGCGADQSGSPQPANVLPGMSLTPSTDASPANPVGGGTGVTTVPGSGGEAGTAAPPAGAGGSGELDPPIVTLPASCADAADAYEIVLTLLDPAFSPAPPAQTWGGEIADVPIAVAADGGVYVGFSRADGDAVIVRSDSTAGMELVLEDAVVAALAVTADGVAALLFDSAEDVDARMWAAVARFGSDGGEIFRTDLFRSPNLDDVDTKGGAAAGVLAYVPETDMLVPYFGHTQRYDDGVRHEGGYLATVDAAGTQDVVSGWFGSHNLSQRIFVDGAQVAVLGLGDAFPKGIFFNYVAGGRPEPHVIYRLAADGVGSTNGKLGGIVDLGTELAMPFITNRSISQDLDAGAWPNTDEAISMQIRDAAASGTDLGLLRTPRGATPADELDAIWIEAEHTAGARLSRLRSASYGPNLILLGWAELTGDDWNPAATYFTMVVDADGVVCQPRTQLPAGHGWAAGDDIVEAPDGSVIWANSDGGGIQLVRLVP